MLRPCLMALALVTLFGCSEHQENELGLGNGSVSSYPQNMSDMQLCQTLYFSRPTNQTRVAIGAEFDRRKLSYQQCKTAYDQNALSALIKAISINKDNSSDSDDSSDES